MFAAEPPWEPSCVPDVNVVAEPLPILYEIQMKGGLNAAGVPQTFSFK